MAFVILSAAKDLCIFSRPEQTAEILRCAQDDKGAALRITMVMAQDDKGAALLG